ncbi:MAG TPA: putative peptide maturation dehydrogenase, partial [Stenotrophomonas sp.]|nr:putative peptide maturation dehydrogenase [Stenotrophomonas sp.]
MVLLEPRETVAFQFEALLDGGDGRVRALGWVALAPHLEQPVALSAQAQAWLGTLSPSAWTELAADAAEMPMAQELDRKS